MKKWVFTGLSVLLIAGLWALVTPDWTGADLRQFENRVGTNITSSVQLGDNVGQDTTDVSGHLEVDSTAAFADSVSMAGALRLDYGMYVAEGISIYLDSFAIITGGRIDTDSFNFDSIDVATEITAAAISADGIVAITGALDATSTVDFTAGDTFTADSLTLDTLAVRAIRVTGQGQGTFIIAAVDTASDDDYLVATNTAVGAIQTGQLVMLTPVTANTDAATLTFGTNLASKAIVNVDLAAIVTNDILASTLVFLYYNGTAWVCLNPAGGTP